VLLIFVTVTVNVSVHVLPASSVIFAVKVITVLSGVEFDTLNFKLYP